MRTSYEAIQEGDLAYTVEETKERQRIGGGLTFVTDEVFKFFLTLEEERQKLHTMDMVKALRSDIFYDSTWKLIANESLITAFRQIFNKVEAPDLQVLNELYDDLIESYMPVANNEYRKVINQILGKKRKFAHRVSIMTSKSGNKLKKVDQKADALSADSPSSSEKCPCSVDTPKSVRSEKGTETAECSTTYTEPLSKPANVEEMNPTEKVKDKGTHEDQNASSPGPHLPSITPGATGKDLASSEAVSVASADGRYGGRGRGKGRGKGRSKMSRKGKGRGKGRGRAKVEEDEEVECPQCHAGEIDQLWIQCYICNVWYHRNCAGLEENGDWALYDNTDNEWSCRLCLL